MSEISVGGLPATGATFRIGAVLNKTFSVFGRQFAKFFLLALLPMVPILIVTLFVYGGGLRSGPPSVSAGVWGGLIGILTFVLQILAQATTLYGAFQEMRNQPFTVGDSLQVGLRRTLPVIGVALLTGLCTGLASALLIIPGIIVLCMLYVAVPACVIERLGVTGSLGRSSALTKGYRWPIFGVVLLVAVISFVAIFVLGRLAGSSVMVVQLLNFAWQVIATAFGSVLSAVIYHDLRAAKEGIDIDKLANVFD